MLSTLENLLSLLKNQGEIYEIKLQISPIGKKGSQYPSCWEMPVKSWIVSPLKSANGNVVVSGVAMGGTKKYLILKFQ